MATDNYFIADQFSLLAKLMDIHGENSFKTKSYSVAAYTIEKLPEQLSAIPRDKIFSIKGIGDAIGKKIISLLDTGELPLLQAYLEKTPPGVMEMMNLKGLGPKKIATVWKEMEIESIGELLYACNENRLMRFKGFGEKTQQNVKATIEFYLGNQGSYLYAQAESFAASMDQKLKDAFSAHRFELTGAFRMQSPVVDKLEWVTTASIADLTHYFESNDYITGPSPDHVLSCKGAEGLRMDFHCTSDELFPCILFETSCSTAFMDAWKEKTGWSNGQIFSKEEEIFSSAGIHFVPPYAREKSAAIRSNNHAAFEKIVSAQDIKGIIHSHSHWSDGSETIEDMAKACIAMGLQYLVISDHSRSAFYANGLTEERISEQHRCIDELNARLAPFRVFKSIECDILNDGSLDYTPDVLNSFDLVSIHSNLKMSEDKAMARLLKAIENPYTNILGHLTGRLLLSRPGYPVDHRRIIDACSVNGVVIELNAHPRRLDMDWEWIDYAIEKNVLISIDPDAHSTQAFGDTRYGVLAAQKAMLPATHNLSSFTLQQFEDFVVKVREKRVIDG